MFPLIALISLTLLDLSDASLFTNCTRIPVEGCFDNLSDLWCYTCSSDVQALTNITCTACAPLKLPDVFSVGVSTLIGFVVFMGIICCICTPCCGCLFTCCVLKGAKGATKTITGNPLSDSSSFFRRLLVALVIAVLILTIASGTSGHLLINVARGLAATAGSLRDKAAADIATAADASAAAVSAIGSADGFDAAANISAIAAVVNSTTQRPLLSPLDVSSSLASSSSSIPITSAAWLSKLIPAAAVVVCAYVAIKAASAACAFAASVAVLVGVMVLWASLSMSSHVVLPLDATCPSFDEYRLAALPPPPPPALLPSRLPHAATTTRTVTPAVSEPLVLVGDTATPPPRMDHAPLAPAPAPLGPRAAPASVLAVGELVCLRLLDEFADAVEAVHVTLAKAACLAAGALCAGRDLADAAAHCVSPYPPTCPTSDPNIAALDLAAGGALRREMDAPAIEQHARLAALADALRATRVVPAVADRGSLGTALAGCAEGAAPCTSAGTANGARALVAAIRALDTAAAVWTKVGMGDALVDCAFAQHVVGYLTDPCHRMRLMTYAHLISTALMAILCASVFVHVSCVTLRWAGRKALPTFDSFDTSSTL